MKKSIYQKTEKISNFFKKRKVQYFTYGGTFAAIVIFIIIDAKGDTGRLTSACGILIILGIAYIASIDPSKIKLRQILWGLGMQFIFALMILRTSLGQETFQCIGEKFTVFLNFTRSGASFAFGPLALDHKYYVFSILTVILFFGMVVSILYYYGIIQWVIIKIGHVLEMTMGTTPCESMATASNIFLGTSEAPLVIYPYISRLTKSELHAVMTGGYATVAGGVLSAYIAFGIKAAHLMSASIMSAPAALVISKIIYPETQDSLTSSNNIEIHKSEEKNLLHAIMNGLSTGLKLIGSITAAIIAFISFVTFINSFMDWFCQLLNYENGTCELQSFIGILLSPLAFILGIPIPDCLTVGKLLGTRIMLTEFLSYKELGTLYNQGLISDRAVMISTYAFCGFANVANLGGTMASLGSMAPTRRGDIAKLLVSALFAGNLACYLTAAVAGTLSADTQIRAVDFNATKFTY